MGDSNRFKTISHQQRSTVIGWKECGREHNLNKEGSRSEKSRDRPEPETPEPEIVTSFVS